MTHKRVTETKLKYDDDGNVTESVTTVTDEWSTDPVPYMPPYVPTTTPNTPWYPSQWPIFTCGSSRSSSGAGLVMVN